MVRAMDAKLVLEALNSDAALEDLTIAERLALARMDLVQITARPVVRAEKLPLRFLVPPALERLVRANHR